MDFDKAYMNMMLSDHKKDIKSFQKAADLKDMDVRNFAVETLLLCKTSGFLQWRSQVKINKILNSRREAERGRRLSINKELC